MHKYRGTELKMCRQLSFRCSTILNISFCSVNLFQGRKKGTTVSYLIPCCCFSKAIRNSIRIIYKYPTEPISFPLGCVKYWLCSVPVKWPCCLTAVDAKGGMEWKCCHHKWRHVIPEAAKQAGGWDMGACLQLGKRELGQKQRGGFITLYSLHAIVTMFSISGMCSLEQCPAPWPFCYFIYLQTKYCF